MVCLQLPSDFWVVFRTNEPKRRSVTVFLYKLTKKDKDQKRKESPFLEILRDNDQMKKHYLTAVKKERIWATICSTKVIFQLSSTKKNLFQLPAFYLNVQTSWVTTLLPPWTNSLVQNMEHADFGKNQDRFGRFFFVQTYSNNLYVKLKLFTRDGIIGFHLVQCLTMGEDNFNQLMHFGNQLTFEAQKLVETKICPQCCWYQHFPTPWMNNWN